MYFVTETGIFKIHDFLTYLPNIEKIKKNLIKVNLFKKNKVEVSYTDQQREVNSIKHNSLHPQTGLQIDTLYHL